ncbi:hypothetical protein ACFOEY_15955 [Paracandidimonas soli]|uniref:Uncharacterized protein n=1 Tax=Paracandidimonas soli TaxID=1917182 RepID=A0A4R3USQ8_9BURK|nr:hypothetical protein EV686_11189 [Paracandidimonas soli]
MAAMAGFELALWGMIPTKIVSSSTLEVPKMFDWFPIVFIAFKLIVFGTGMFFAIKWHYDQGKKKK